MKICPALLIDHHHQNDRIRIGDLLRGRLRVESSEQVFSHVTPSRFREV